MARWRTKHNVTTSIEGSDATGFRSPSLPPEDLVLLLLGMDNRFPEGATQRAIARVTFLSQPTVSRVLKNLRAQGHIRSFLPGPWERRNPEKTYEPSTLGLLRLRNIWMGLKRVPSSHPVLRAVDVIDLHPNLPATDLLILCLRKVPFDVEHPEAALKELEGLRSNAGYSPLPPPSIPSEPEDGNPSVRSLIGRVKQAGTILAALSRASGSEPHPSCIAFLGPAGIGKSSLLQYAQQVAERRGFAVRRARAVEMERFPFYLFDELQLGSRNSGTSNDSGMPRSHRTLSVSERMLSIFRRLESDARNRPLLLVVDEAHQMTLSGLAMLEFLIFNMADARLPIVTLLAARSERNMNDRSHRVLTRILALGRRQTGQVRIEEVPPLGPEEAQQLVDRVNAQREVSHTSQRIFSRVMLKSKGNPLYLIEWLHDLHERGVLSGEGLAALSPEELPVPASLERLFESRLSRLPRRDQTLLEMASVVGEAFDLSPIIAMAEGVGWGSAADVCQALEGVVHSTDYLHHESPHRYAFTHPLIPEVLSHRNPNHLQWYSFLAHWWSTHHPEDVERVAKLFYRAGDGPNGFVWIRKAIARAVRQEAWEIAEEYLDWLHELERGGAHGLDIRPLYELEIAREMRWGGALAPAERILRHLSQTDLEVNMRWEVEENLLACLAITDPGAAEAHQRSLLSKGGMRIPEAWRGPILVQSSWVALRRGDPQKGLRLAEQALRIADTMKGQPAWSGQGWIALATAHFLLGRYDRALTSMVRKYRNFPFRIRASLRIQRTNLEGRIWLALGRPYQARRVLVKGWEITEETGRVTAHSLLLTNLALAEIDLELLDKAEETIERCLRLTRQFGLKIPHAWALVQRGHLRLHQHNLGALTDFKDAARTFESVHMEGAVLLCRIYEDFIEGLTGDAREGIRRLTRWQGMLFKVPVEERPPVDLFLAGLWERLDDATTAREMIERALRDARRTRRALHVAHALACLSRWHLLHGNAPDARRELLRARTLYRKLGIRDVPGGERYLGLIG